MLECLSELPFPPKILNRIPKIDRSLLLWLPFMILKSKNFSFT
ncbi:hypothetical protein MC7420_3713 [Coleofasciculus chthonoplastes PCC 7420]|uniref:Uncharacterized protein n=1 Tax=Coleofasciculus chthonoplastes PCC 7420 TaxID=118168 RepID=B4VX18_9CYAN|nr:hypothetical protein MC7420_3713 [Coleofasciculus chthonoplastes PCC 7420]